MLNVHLWLQPYWSQLGQSWTNPSSIDRAVCAVMCAVTADQSAISTMKSDSYAGVLAVCMHAREQFIGEVGVVGIILSAQHNKSRA